MGGGEGRIDCGCNLYNEYLESSDVRRYRGTVKSFALATPRQDIEHGGVRLVDGGLKGRSGKQTPTRVDNPTSSVRSLNECR